VRSSLRRQTRDQVQYTSGAITGRRTRSGGSGAVWPLGALMMGRRLRRTWSKKAGGSALQVLGPFQQRAGGREQRRAGRGQGHRAAVAVEQPHPKVVFEGLDLLRQRGPGDQQPLGGPAEVQLLGHRDEIPQLAQLHACHVTRRGRLRLPAARTPVVAPVLVARAQWSHGILRKRSRRRPAAVTVRLKTTP
jgi:hypothetical protein